MVFRHPENGVALSVFHGYPDTGAIYPDNRCELNVRFHERVDSLRQHARVEKIGHKMSSHGRTRINSWSAILRHFREQLALRFGSRKYRFDVV
jgi:hypothetical protein